jgi:antirestriction protein ArdC
VAEAACRTARPGRNLQDRQGRQGSTGPVIFQLPPGLVRGAAPPLAATPSAEKTGGRPVEAVMAYGTGSRCRRRDASRGSQPPAGDAASSPAGSIYEQVTARIISELEQGTVPWVQPWAAGSAGFALPRNAATGRGYSGINILLLWDAISTCGFASSHWLTFRQALSLGGRVRKGERGAAIVHADSYTPQAERARAAETGEDARSVHFLKKYTVFNLAQCDLPEDVRARLGIDSGSAEAASADEPLIDARMKTIMAGSGADIRFGGDRAYYIPSADYIQLPPPSAFFDTINFNRTAAHELSHWTGHASRLSRDFSGKRDRYAREELVAELSAAFVCAALGIQPTVRHADYLGAWLDILRADSRAIFQAASLASKAADYLLAFEAESSATSIASHVEAKAAA